jgi:hypothetical protein
MNPDTKMLYCIMLFGGWSKTAENMPILHRNVELYEYVQGLYQQAERPLILQDYLDALYKE